MKKLFLLYLAFAVIATGGCKFKSDILASYDGGVITSSDLSQWLDSRIMQPAKNSNQKIYLRQIALERLQVQEAKKMGYDTKPEYINRLATAEGNFIAAYYRQKLREKSEFSEESVRAGVIRLKVETEKNEKNGTVKLSDSAVKKNLMEKTALARTVIKELKSGAAFEDMAVRYSDDVSKQERGDIGYLAAGMREPEFINVLFRLKKGEMTEEPVFISGSIYIVKATDRVVLTPENIDKIIGDEAKAGRLSRRLKMNSVRNLEARLAAMPDVYNNIEKAFFNNKASVLFKVGENSYTAGDLNKALAIVESNRKSGGLTRILFDDKQKRFLADKIFRDKLLEREARRLKIDQEQKYIRQWESVKDSTLISLYRDEVIIAPVAVTEGMLRDEYNSMKKAQINGSGAMSNERLMTRVVKKKRMETVRNWEQGLLDKNHYTAI